MDLPGRDEMDAVRAGRPEAFAELFDRYADTVFTYCVRRTGNAAASEDMVAEVFLEAWRQRHTVVLSDGSLRPWLLGVAHNLVRHWWRTNERAGRAASRLPVAEVTDDLDAVIDRVSGQQQIAHVVAAVARLPEPQREVLLLWAWDELSYGDIAVALGISIGTVRSRLNRARRHLAALDGAIGPTDLAPGNPIIEGGVA